MATQPEVFIIESLTFANEEKRLFEGKILSQILALSKKQCKYIYIRTKRELIAVLRQFTESKYRYLHLSCHGNDHTVATTLDQIPFDEFSRLIRPHLSHRRLFVSACSMTNPDLARMLMPRSDCYSMLGPTREIAFSDATILWSSLYHIMFRHDPASMAGGTLRKNAQLVSNMYGVGLSYFGRDRQNLNGYRHSNLSPSIPS